MHNTLSSLFPHPNHTPPLPTKAKRIRPAGERERERRESGGRWADSSGGRAGGGVGTRKMTVSTGTVISAALPPDEKGPLQPTVPTVRKGQEDDSYVRN